MTTGSQSNGIAAESIGGSGGNGGFTVSANGAEYGALSVVARWRGRDWQFLRQGVGRTRSARS